MRMFLDGETLIKVNLCKQNQIKIDKAEMKTSDPSSGILSWPLTLPEQTFSHSPILTLQPYTRNMYP